MAESFMKTLKAEEVNARKYIDLDDARAHVGVFIADVYNADRLHSAFGYKPPVAFEDDFHKTEAAKTTYALSLN